MGGGWADRLKRFCIEEFEDFEVYNLGISGDKTKDVLSRFEVECKAREPEIIIFAIGINDTSHESGGLSVKQTEENAIRLIKMSRIFTNKVVFVGLTNVDEKGKYNSYKNSEIKKYNESIKKICQKEGLLFLDLFGSIKNEELFDGLHPNSKGHEKIFKKVKDFMIKNNCLK